MSCGKYLIYRQYFQFGGDLGINVLMERMKKLTETDSGDMTSEELLQQFENVENQSAESKFSYTLFRMCDVYFNN